MTTARTSLVGALCPICESDQVVDLSHSEYIRCLDCGVIRTIYDYSSDIYGENYAQTYVEYANSPSNLSLNLFRLGLVARWLTPNSAILDIGCCVGEFIRFAEKHYHCMGFEPNLMAARIARTRVHSSVVTKLPEKRVLFNCVTMFDVIEHLENPKEALENVKTLLSSKGVLAITTPNVGVVPVDQITEWKHYKPKEHLFLYTETALINLLQGLGFEILHVGNEESEIRPGNPNGDILTVVARNTWKKSA